MTRFDVPPLANVARELAAVAAERLLPDLVITGGRLLSVYTDRFLPNRELWISQGRIAAVKPAGTCRDSRVALYDGKGGILAPGLVDPHVHIESSMSRSPDMRTYLRARFRCCLRCIGSD
jgi:adenine deaminase